MIFLLFLPMGLMFPLFTEETLTLENTLQLHMGILMILGYLVDIN